MIIGVPKEIKDHETRVGCIPSIVTALGEHGHRVVVESGPGIGSSITDEEYEEAGAIVLLSAADRPRRRAHGDAVIGAVLIPSAAAPRIVRRDMNTMKRGSVIVDVAIDQGGCVETAHATTHTDPIYFVDGVLHYCVSNMPAAVPHTSAFGLTNATIPYLLALRTRAWSGLATRVKR